MVVHTDNQITTLHTWKHINMRGEGRKEGRKEGREGGREGGREEGRKEGERERDLVTSLICHSPAQSRHRILLVLPPEHFPVWPIPLPPDCYKSSSIITSQLIMKTTAKSGLSVSSLIFLQSILHIAEWPLYVKSDQIRSCTFLKFLSSSPLWTHFPLLFHLLQLPAPHSAL